MGVFDSGIVFMCGWFYSMVSLFVRFGVCGWGDLMRFDACYLSDVVPLCCSCVRVWLVFLFGSVCLLNGLVIVGGCVWLLWGALFCLGLGLAWGFLIVCFECGLWIACLMWVV